MRSKRLLFFILLLISDDVFGKNGNKTKSIKPVHKTHNGKQNDNIARIKRSLDEEQRIDNSNQYESYINKKGKHLKFISIIEKDSPFWGARGRRESSSEETVGDVILPISNGHKQNKNFYKLILNVDGEPIRDQVTPFWSSRGRRNSDESSSVDNPEVLFWANRGRRQDDEPFWGTRGRRHEDSPFWGKLGNRVNIMSRHIDSPHWITRGSFDDDEPFWGNRGRREEPEPFWGNRGRRESTEQFTGSRGKMKPKSMYSNNNSDQKNDFKDSIIEALNYLNNKVNTVARDRRDNVQAPYWINRNRDSKIKSLFNGITRTRLQYNPKISDKIANTELHSKTFEQNTVQDDRVFAEEPHYILVERTSRSSAEDDPFFISRGKKYSDYEISNTVRGRRGAIEEIVKSVRNDPYYIARGKKDNDKTGDSNTTGDPFIKTKNLVCATIDLLMTKYEGKVKRDISDNDRDRRATLKKLALQLQMDPYFVSRGKKDLGNQAKPDIMENFIKKVEILCN